MDENWNAYMCRVNGEIASIFLNLALKRKAPLPDKGWLLWAWVYLQKPRPDGLSDGSELDSLIALEVTLCDRLLESCGAILSGTITTQGRREFYFYGPSPDGFEQVVSEAIAEHDGYSFDTGVQPDPQWNQFLNLLYPSDEELSRMKIRDTQ